MAQVEYCDNLLFKRRATLDALSDRLLDANRQIGQPRTLSLILGRRLTRRHGGKLQTVIEDLELGNPVIRSHYRNGFLKQYARDRRLWRTELATNDVTDYGHRKSVEQLPPLRPTLQGITDNYLNLQQDILETFVDRGQLQQLRQPTFTPSGRRIPELRLDHPRQLSLMQALVRFSHLAAGGLFTTRELHPSMAQVLTCSTEECKLSSVRYELSKLRAKGLAEKIPHPAATACGPKATGSASFT